MSAAGRRRPTRCAVASLAATPAWTGTSAACTGCHGMERPTPAHSARQAETRWGRGRRRAKRIMGAGLSEK
uniref:CxxxxCH/CxxCH domain-containing protein n=1 Tax=Massilia scottii TaxID=3057166 RepID=UPI0035B51F9A